MYYLSQEERNHIAANTSPCQFINEFNMFTHYEMPLELPVSEKLLAAHVVNKRHCSLRDMRHNLNQMFPGHRVHYRLVVYFYYAGPLCHKARQGLRELDTIKLIVKNLKPEHARGRVGIDMLVVTPPDAEGHVAVHVIVDHFSNLVYFHAV